MQYDVIIIGAGPAGLTAALYTGRYRLAAVMIEKLAAGGQIVLSHAIENYPGFPGGISTGELIERFKKQVDELEVPFHTQEVLKVRATEGAQPSYLVETEEHSYEAKTIIIASGAQSKRLGAENEERLTGRGVSYCGTCDGPLFKGKDVAVIGGGDRAIEEALFLVHYAGKVNVIHRRTQLRASRILEEKARRTPKINFVLDTVVEGILGQQRVEAIKIKNLKTGRVSELPCQGVFIFVGIEPSTAFLKDFVEIDESGFIVTDQNMKTSREGIFACGDCRKKELYQVINACAEGAVAAYSAHRYLLNL